jgi:hypothetical protein
MQNLEYKLEASAIEWIASAEHGQALGIPVLHADDDDETQLPRLVVFADAVEEAIHNAGIWRVELNLEIYMQADDTPAASAHDLWGKLRTIFSCDDIQVKLSVPENLHVHGVVRDIPQAHRFEDRTRVKVMPFTCYAMNLDDPEQSSSSSESSSSSSSSQG